MVGSGFAWTAARDLSAEGVTERTRARFQTAILVNTLLGLALALAMQAAYAAGWVNLGPAYRLMVPLVGVTTVLLAARAALNGAMRGFYRFPALAANLTGEVVIKMIVGLALVRLGWGASGVMLAFVIGAAGSLLHAIWVLRGRGLFTPPARLDFSVAVDTIPLFVGMVGAALMLNLDVIGLKQFAPQTAGDALAGVYQAGVIMARTPVFIAQALAIVIFSYAAAAASGKDPQAARLAYLQTAVRAWLRMLAPVSIGLALAPAAVLSIFFPAAYAGSAASLELAAIGGGMLALVTLLIGVFQAQKDRKRPALAAAGGVIAQLAVLAVYVPTYGTRAAAASLIAGGAVTLLGLLPSLRIPLADWRRQIVAGGAGRAASGLLWTLLPAALMAIVVLAVPGSGRVQALIKFGVAGLVYLAALAACQQRLRPSAPPRPARGRQGAPALVFQFLQMLMGGTLF
jgi:O-antigen/teichoic acid export membrane protein